MTRRTGNCQMVPTTNRVGHRSGPSGGHQKSSCQPPIPHYYKWSGRASLQYNGVVLMTTKAQPQSDKTKPETKFGVGSSVTME